MTKSLKFLFCVCLLCFFCFFIEFMRKSSLLIEAARMLRKEMTPQEKHLWFDFLRHYPIKIYRQRIINKFVADFCCAKAKLIIELDGSQHYTEDGLAHDIERTNILNALGFLVLRFPNKEIDCNFSSVCTKIDDVIQERIAERLEKRRP